jgi:ABC-type multidrug transport system fused ATPase/permease subunit
MARPRKVKELGPRRREIVRRFWPGTGKHRLLTDATPEQVEDAARPVNAHPFIEAPPEGYDTVVGERGVTLAGGKRQGIAIARAAIRNAPILTLDEPTTGLGEENSRQVREALERLAEGHTTFVVTHDPRQVADADQVLFLEDGQVSGQAHPDPLMEAGSRYATLVRLAGAPRARRNGGGPAGEVAHLMPTRSAAQE